MKKRTIIALVVVLVAGAILMPVASASPGAGIWYSGGSWFIPCGPGVDGAFQFDFEATVPAGYTIIATWAWDSVSRGTPSYYGEWVESVGLYGSGPEYWVVPYDGWVELTHRVLAPDGTLLTSARAFASCLTGDIVVGTSDIYTAVLPPDPLARVQAQVLVDVPVFREPNPDTPIPDTMLKAGQEWFVVGEATGADGNVWYEVFVGGLHNGWVPSAALFLPGPIPE